MIGRLTARDKTVMATAASCWLHIAVIELGTYKGNAGMASFAGVIGDDMP